MGNLIDRLGGYEATKEYLKKNSHFINFDGLERFYDELLEYRRKNNIFEEGDYYVYLQDWDCDLDIICKFTVSKWSDHLWNITNMIRHATDEEIKTGGRL